MGIDPQFLHKNVLYCEHMPIYLLSRIFVVNEPKRGHKANIRKEEQIFWFSGLLVLLFYCLPQDFFQYKEMEKITEAWLNTRKIATFFQLKSSYSTRC